MEFWYSIVDYLKNGYGVVLLYVVKSEGSSPGRRGFKMFVVSNGDLNGTIGGGIMEHKLVELARDQLRHGRVEVHLKPQHHDKEHVVDQSGLICSGSQHIAVVPLTDVDIATCKEIGTALQAKMGGLLSISMSGLSFNTRGSQDTDGLHVESLSCWQYHEKVGAAPVLHIIGGGHVGLRVSEIMKSLGFYIKIYDDRRNLNTISDNQGADETVIHAYENLSEVLENNQDHYVAIMTTGYRTDRVVLEQIIDRNYKYIGMMGSDTKVEKMFAELREAGYSEAQLKKIHAPIGLPIHSKTSREIAISVAAEIIQVKNRNIPMGRDRHVVLPFEKKIDE